MQRAIQRGDRRAPRECSGWPSCCGGTMNFSYEEIAEILELSVPAVKSVIFRARTELREKLRVYLDA